MRISLASVFREPSRLAAALGATLQARGCVCSVIGGITTDSRRTEAGDLFVARKGRGQNGLDFIGEALARGACAVLAETEPPFYAENCLWLRVPDCDAALLAAAAARRQKTRATVIAVSGSTGKTTVKELLATVLGEVGTVQSSAGNYNSTVGMPLSLLGMEEADYFVLEIGINHKNEMEPLSRALAPDIAVLTNVGTAHIGQYGNYATLLEEKLKLSCGLRENGVLVLPDSIPKAALSGISSPMLRFGSTQGCDVRVCRAVSHELGVTADILTPARALNGLCWHIPGSIGTSCLAIAAAVGTLLEVPDAAIRHGIAKAVRTSPRMQRIEVAGRVLIDDTYNASPEAVVASLEALCYLGKDAPRAAVLGDIGELGEQAATLHRTVGRCAAGCGLAQLFLYGEYASVLAAGAQEGGMPKACIKTFAAGQEAELASALLSATPKGTYILLKASRKTALERVIEALRRER